MSAQLYSHSNSPPPGAGIWTPGATLTAYEIFRILNFEVPPFSGLSSLDNRPRQAHEVDAIARQVWNRMSSGDKWVFAERERAAAIVGAGVYRKLLKEHRIVPGLARSAIRLPPTTQATRNDGNSRVGSISTSSPLRGSRLPTRGVCLGWNENMPTPINSAPTLLESRTVQASTPKLEGVQRRRSSRRSSITSRPRSSSTVLSPSLRGNTDRFETQNLYEGGWSKSMPAISHFDKTVTAETSVVSPILPRSEQRSFDGGWSGTNMPEMEHIEHVIIAQEVSEVSTAPSVPGRPSKYANDQALSLEPSESAETVIPSSQRLAQPVVPISAVSRDSRARSKSKSRAMSPRRYVLKRNHISLVPVSRHIKKPRLSSDRSHGRHGDEEKEEDARSWVPLRKFLEEKRSAAGSSTASVSDTV